MNVKNFLSGILLNFAGKKLKDKVLVIESDDWGSIRMPNPETYKVLLNSGIPVDKSAYCKFDTLETREDWEKLMNVLNSVKNTHGEHPVFTANYVTANPDFKKIRESDFRQYFYEPITDTYNRSGMGNAIFRDIKTSLNFVPQFHGRDHVNVLLWFELLKSNQHFKLAFDYGLWGLSKDVFPQIRKSIQATYDSCDLNYCIESLEIGMDLFEKIFGYRSTTFIANNFIWSPEIENCLIQGGVRYLQGMKYQLLPLYSSESKRKRIRHFFGERNKAGMYFGVRNCSFELTEGKDTVSETLNQIRLAFLLGKPAVISTHRINYASGMSRENRDRNLKLLRELLKSVVHKWPDVRFLSSNQIYDKLINSND